MVTMTRSVEESLGTAAESVSEDIETTTDAANQFVASAASLWMSSLKAFARSFDALTMIFEIALGSRMMIFEAILYVVPNCAQLAVVVLVSPALVKITRQWMEARLGALYRAQEGEILCGAYGCLQSMKTRLWGRGRRVEHRQGEVAGPADAARVQQAGPEDVGQRPDLPTRGRLGLGVRCSPRIPDPPDADPFGYSAGFLIRQWARERRVETVAGAAVANCYPEHARHFL